MENLSIVVIVNVGLKLQNFIAVLVVITCLGVVVHHGIGGEILKMRCKCCKKVVKTANKPSRTRMICGICLKSTKKLLKTIPLVVNNG